MRRILTGLGWMSLALLPLQAMAQDFPDGGMGGGGMGGPGGGPPGMGGPSGGPREPKPIKRKKLDETVERMFVAADTNRNGLVTLAELNAIVAARKEQAIRARFDAMDADRNQSISWAEFLEAQRKLGSVVLSDQAARGRDDGIVAEEIPVDMGGDRDGMMLSGLIEPLSATVIAAANTNYDAGVSLEELLAYERQRFDAADKDGDGALSMEELDALHPRGETRGGPGGQGGQGGPPPRR